MNEWGLALQRNYVTFQDGGPQEIQWSRENRKAFYRFLSFLSIFKFLNS